MTIPQFRRKILTWHTKNRREMPWRNTRDPYKILVSEVMLQQTQVSRVLPKYEEFLKEFPILKALARAPDRKLLRVWAGLGYWRRAKNLKEIAKIIARDYNGKFPKTPEELEKLPGVGHYTARAVACFAFGSKEAFLDTNIRRVYLHFFFPNKENVSDKKILEIAQDAVSSNSDGRRNRIISPREWHYALFDYGATVLSNKSINKRSRHYAKQSKFEGSFRSYRTKVVRFLLSQPKSRASHKAVETFLKKLLRQAPLHEGRDSPEQDKKTPPYSPDDIIEALLKDKLIKKTQKYYSL